ncbi:hypothetical protein [Pseudonocardia sp. H11422]|uniref:hypothetical protein n=1 Tax=Pseudonocardia sp. H11422 TaxID=2835866 RepID=UPI001BDBCED1|nr:hypothetical protein [Pseudonocardia sp. H11422]
MAYEHTLLGERITWTDGETERARPTGHHICPRCADAHRGTVIPERGHEIRAGRYPV